MAYIAADVWMSKYWNSIKIFDFLIEVKIKSV